MILLWWEIDGCCSAAGLNALLLLRYKSSGANIQHIQGSFLAPNN
jgi:hypothetical protein